MTKLQALKAEKIKRQCAKDPIFFINHFVHTLSFTDENPNGKVILFKLWDFQEDFVKEMYNAYKDKTDIVLDKSRDMGVSWINISFDVWAWLFEPNFQCLWGSKKEDDVDLGGDPKTLFGKADIILRHLPAYLMPRGWNVEKHRNFMRMKNPENGNIISGESANQQFSRSGRFSKIFLDEFAFWDYAESVWTATGDSSRHRIAVSTPNGMGNTFADIRFSGNAQHVEMHWKLHPDKGEGAYFDKEERRWRSPWYDKEVTRRRTSKDTSLKNIRQELDISYIQSGDPVFNGTYLIKHVLERKHPHRDENYAIGADVSEGLEGGDNSSFDIIAKSTGKQVFSWQGKCSTEEFAWKLIEFGNEYNEALLGIEINNAGIAVMNVAKKYYKKLYMQKRSDYRTDVSTQKVGWHTNKKTKSQMIVDLQAALIEGEVKITHQKTLDEMTIFQTDGAGKYSAPKGKHDDAVMSLAITWQILKDVRVPLSAEEREDLEAKKSRKRKRGRKKLVSSTCGY